VGVSKAGHPLGGGGERDPVSGLAGPDPESDGQVVFAGAGRAEEDHVLLRTPEVPPIPQEQLAELADRLADARLMTIAAGHLVHETVPDDYLKTLIAFLAE
jgi:pimeloyl-ACP methyl ester carboxylesterase